MTPLSQFRILATDYDGTLTEDGSVDPGVLQGLRRLRESGRRIILVTGRDLDELLEICPDVDLFNRVVAENGAVLYRPATGDVTALAAPPDPAFVARLRRDGVAPLVLGRAIVATRTPYNVEVARAIDELGLPLEISYNKGAVMVLPAGIDKASGLRRALDDLNLSGADAIGIGDAENDEPFLGICGLSVAVANAIRSFKERADMVTVQAAGQGVLELIEAMLASPAAVPRGDRAT